MVINEGYRHGNVSSAFAHTAGKIAVVGTVYPHVIVTVPPHWIDIDTDSSPRTSNRMQHGFGAY